MTEHTRTAQTLEGAVLTVKIDWIIRALAIGSAILFWYGLAFGLVLLHLLGVLQLSKLGSFALVGMSLGLAPIPIALATWRAFEVAYSKAIRAYARSHIQT